MTETTREQALESIRNTSIPQRCYSIESVIADMTAPGRYISTQDQEVLDILYSYLEKSRKRERIT